MNDIGPGWLDLLKVLITAAVTIIPVVINSRMLARKAKEAADAAIQTRDEKLDVIHSAVNSNMDKALERIEKLETAINGMLAARGATEQATADKAGVESLKK